jgi:hypothetical protein
MGEIKKKLIGRMLTFAAVRWWKKSLVQVTLGVGVTNNKKRHLFIFIFSYICFLLNILILFHPIKTDMMIFLVGILVDETYICPYIYNISFSNKYSKNFAFVSFLFIYFIFNNSKDFLPSLFI